MRRATTLVLAALGAVLAAPVDADARPAIPLGGLVGVIASPLRALGGARRAHGSSRHHRRSARSHARARTPSRPAPPDLVTKSSRAIAAADPGSPGLQVWPTAFQDALGYAVAPDDYGERFWAHGYGDVIAAMLAPAASAFASGGRTASRHHRRRTVRANGQDTARRSGQSCAGIAPGGDGLTARMLETITLSEPQRRAFEEFRTAFADAMEKIEATCRDEMPMSAPARLQAMEDRLTAVQYAELHVRGPLAKFYDALTEAQKVQFERRAFADRRERNRGRPGGGSPGRWKHDLRQARLPGGRSADEPDRAGRSDRAKVSARASRRCAGSRSSSIAIWRRLVRSSRRAIR